MPTTRRATLRSLAKINIDLRVLHKRADGFHQLSTVFQTISLADQISVEWTSSPRTRVDVTCNVDIPDNILIRATEALLTASRSRASVHFQLDKRIPMGGGMGGGSSNAATVLLALPVIGGFALPFPKLEAIASSLGSDVPFFLYGGTASGTGRGADLMPLPDLPKVHGIVVTPGIHISTAEAYRSLDRSVSEPQPIPPAARRLAWTMAAETSSGLAQSTWPDLTTNDFEPELYRLHPQLKRIHSTLASTGARMVRMSGSGSTLFALYDNAADARRVSGSLPFSAQTFTTITRREYYRLWHSQLTQLTLGDSWPPLSRYAP